MLVGSLLARFSLAREIEQTQCGASSQCVLTLAIRAAATSALTPDRVETVVSSGISTRCELNLQTTKTGHPGLSSMYIPVHIF